MVQEVTQAPQHRSLHEPRLRASSSRRASSSVMSAGQPWAAATAASRADPCSPDPRFTPVVIDLRPAGPQVMPSHHLERDHVAWSPSAPRPRVRTVLTWARCSLVNTSGAAGCNRLQPGRGARQDVVEAAGALHSPAVERLHEYISWLSDPGRARRRGRRGRRATVRRPSPSNIRDPRIVDRAPAPRLPPRQPVSAPRRLGAPR